MIRLQHAACMYRCARIPMLNKRCAKYTQKCVYLSEHLLSGLTLPTILNETIFISFSLLLGVFHDGSGHSVYARFGSVCVYVYVCVCVLGMSRIKLDTFGGNLLMRATVS